RYTVVRPGNQADPFRLQREGARCQLLARGGVGRDHGSAVRDAELGRGHAALAEPDHHHRLLGKVHGFYLSFIEERLTSASRIEMIQKRTMMRGSGQPLFSKWWWMGPMRKPRLPVSLKDTTCVITLTASRKKTPPKRADKISFLVNTASVPSPPPKE